MQSYTYTAILLIIEDFKRYSRFIKTASLLFTTAYFIYVLIMRSGFFIANIILASIFFIYTFFDLFTRRKDIKTTRRYIRYIYAGMKYSIKLVTLGAMMYGVYTATVAMTPFSTITTTLLIVLWMLQVSLEVVINIIESKVSLVVAGFDKDKEIITKPIRGVKNFFKALVGKPVEDVKEPPEELKRIEQKIEELRELKAKEKEAAKAKNKEKASKKEEENDKDDLPPLLK